MAKNLNRVVGLDSLRFIATLLVMLTHNLVEPPIFHWAGIDTNAGLPKFLQAIYWKFFYTGNAEVIIFFIISGFCIHHLHIKALKIPNHAAYFLRRFLRIIPPALPVVAYYHWQDGLSIWEAATHTVLWSICCEISYYILYPYLLILRSRYSSWLPLIGIAFVLAQAVSLSNLEGRTYLTLSPWLHWLMGAELAERISKSPSLSAPSSVRIWILRGSAWCFAAFIVALYFKNILTDPFLLNFFAVFAFFWLWQEIRFFRVNPPSKILEHAGTWS